MDVCEAPQRNRGAKSSCHRLGPWQDALVATITFVMQLISFALCGVAYAEGIAAQYPGDVGLERDSAVILFENFDRASIGDLAAVWTLTMNQNGMALVSDVPAGIEGGSALEQFQSSGLYQELPLGYDELYLRYYVKYEALGSSNPYRHTGLVLGGWTPLNGFLKGYSDFVPEGDEWFAAYFEPREGHRLDFYNYWPGMVPWGALVSPPAINPDTGSYYAAGNGMIGSEEVRFIPDEWMCIEYRILLNDPVNAANGELTLWINGELVADFGPGHPLVELDGTDLIIDPDGAPFGGLQWRSDPALRLNYIWLNHYPDVQSTVQFDQLVVATKYVGPITAVPEPPMGLSLGACLATLVVLRRLGMRRTATLARPRLSRSAVPGSGTGMYSYSIKLSSAVGFAGKPKASVPV